MTLIAPSLLAADFLQLKSEVESIEKAGADWLHIDVMDGHFVPNLSFGFPILEAVRSTSNLFFDVHLMISNPTNYISQYVQAGAQSITIHEEIEEDVLQALRLIKQSGAKVGLSIKPSTPFEKVKPFLNEIDLLLFMTVEPGFGGQSFIVNILDKIKEADEYRKQEGYHSLLFQVDGGINIETAALCREHHVDVLVAGTTIFKASSREHIISELKGVPKETTEPLQLDELLLFESRKTEIIRELEQRFGIDGEIRLLQQLVKEEERIEKIKHIYSLFLLGKSYNEIKDKIMK